MKSIFLRSLSVSTTDDAACATAAARSPADGTFAVARRSEGLIQVYAASCGALLHEFSTIHQHVHALEYTSFSDSLITLESNRPYASRECDGMDAVVDEETFLCVYHDWRERNMVRAYTLPLGVLDSPSSKRVSDTFAVCSYSGRVVVAMGSVLNVWQCSHGFFEHVLELKVDMTQRDAYHVVEFVAIHGMYLAYASSTEVRVMEIHVQSADERVVAPVAVHPVPHSATLAPEPSDEGCLHFSVNDAVEQLEAIPIPLASYGDSSDSHDRGMLAAAGDEVYETPMVLGKSEAQDEIDALAGLVRNHDVRVNQAMSYFVAEKDVRVLLRRYLPPNQPIQTIQFLPETTIDSVVAREARSYSRLLISTHNHAFLYYFISREADATRKHMKRKVLGRTKSQLARTHSTPPPPAGCANKSDDSETTTRIVMHYAFDSHVSCVAANSSFLFVTTAASLQVWSIWSPCYHLAADRSSASVPVSHEPTQPQLISVQPLVHAAADLVALDSFVIVVPVAAEDRPSSKSKDLIRLGSAGAAELLPATEFERRRSTASLHPEARAVPSIMIYQQRPPTAIFSMLQQDQSLRTQSRIDLLLSLYSLYRYRADVGATTLAAAKDAAPMDTRAAIGLQLETAQYHRLACECALVLAKIFASPSTATRDLGRAVFFYLASSLSPSRVVAALQRLDQSSEVACAIHQYIYACVFQSSGAFPAKTADEPFTKVAVAHFVAHAPDQLTRLVTDSTLAWRLEDLAYAHDLLQQGAGLPTAELMLRLRALAVPPAQWDACRSANALLYDRMRVFCAADAVGQAVAAALAHDHQSLVLLCVGHTDLLVTAQGEASLLSTTLLGQAPITLFEILCKVVDDAVLRRESISLSLMHCLKAIGAAAQPALLRLHTPQHLRTDASLPADDVGRLVTLRFVGFVLDALPRFVALAERDQLNEEEEELHRLRRWLAMELVHACIDLSASDARRGGGQLLGELFSSYAHNTDSVETVRPALPEWELEYVEARCLAGAAAQSVEVLRHLLQRSLAFVHEAELLAATDLLALYEKASASSDLAFLLVLLSLPRVHRTIDALQLIATRPGLLDLFLPYSKSHCATLAEWKFVIETLSAMTDASGEVDMMAHDDELGVLESVLHHVCSTLGPEELLQVLPDDGDLALFMSTIEASVRLERIRTTQPSVGMDGLVAA